MDGRTLGHGDTTMKSFDLRQVIQQPSTRLVAGLVLVCALGFGPLTYGVVTSGSRLDDTVSHAATTQSRVNLVIVLGFKAQTFNIHYLQSYGQIGAETSTSVQLRDVSRTRLEALARTPWISRIELLQS